MSDETHDRGSIRRIAGLVLTTIGVIWMAGAGLCSAGFVAMLFTEGGDFREALSIVPMIALVGGFAIGLGFVFYLVGRALRPNS